MKSRINPKVYDALMRRSRGRCEWCRSNANCGIDHIIPRSKGGTNKKWNLQYLCGRCGSWKGGDLPKRVVNRLKRLKPKSDWARAIKSVGLRKMQEFLHRLEMKEMESSGETKVESTFPNPLEIALGEGKVGCQVVMTSGGGGIVFAMLDESGEVGATGESLIGGDLKRNQVLLVCRNRQGAEILKMLATHVCDMMEHAEHLQTLPDSNEDNNSEE